MKIHCAYTELWALDKFVENPKNDNDHKKEHAELLAKFMSVRGVRHPIIVSKRSGFIVAGHLRLMAAHILGLEEYPVDLQDFENEADEYAFLSGDNNIARYAEFNESKFLSNLEELNLDLETIDYQEFGFLDFDFLKLDKIEEEKDDILNDGNKEYILEVKLPNELELRDLYDDLEGKGYMVKEK